MGYQISRMRNTVFRQCWQKNALQEKVIFGPKKGFYVIFFLSCLKMVVFELMLLELGDLLVSSLLKNFFSAARVIFSCKTLQGGND